MKESSNNPSTWVALCVAATTSYSVVEYSSAIRDLQPATLGYAADPKLFKQILIFAYIMKGRNDDTLQYPPLYGNICIFREHQLIMMRN